MFSGYNLSIYEYMKKHSITIISRTTIPSMFFYHMIMPLETTKVLKPSTLQTTCLDNSIYETLDFYM